MNIPFSSMPIYILADDLITYKKIAEKALRNMPALIVAKPKQEGHYLVSRIYFGDDQTDFYVSAKGELMYFDAEEELCQRVTSADIIEQFNKTENNLN